MKVKLSDFNIFNEIAQEKLDQGEYSKDALNNAWQEELSYTMKRISIIWTLRLTFAGNGFQGKS